MNKSKSAASMRRRPSQSEFLQKKEMERNMQLLKMLTRKLERKFPKVDKTVVKKEAARFISRTKGAFNANEVNDWMTTIPEFAAHIPKNDRSLRRKQNRRTNAVPSQRKPKSNKSEEPVNQSFSQLSLRSEDMRAGSRLDNNPHFPHRQTLNNDDDDWAVMTILNRVKEEKEREEERLADLKRKNQMKQQLDEQLESQKHDRRKQIEEERQFAELQKRDIDDYIASEQERSKKLREKMEQEKQERMGFMRRQQELKERESERRRCEELEQSRRTQEELDRVKQLANERKLKQKNEMAKIIAENTKQREIRMEQLKKEAEEERKLAIEHQRILDEQERIREENLQKTYQKQEMLQKINMGTQEKESNRLKQLEDQILAYQRAREEEDQRNEIERKAKRDNANKEQARILNMQIELQKKLEAERKREERIFANKFQMEAETALKLEKEKEEARKMRNLEHRRELEAQMRNTQHGLLSETAAFRDTISSLQRQTPDIAQEVQNRIQRLDEARQRKVQSKTMRRSSSDVLSVAGSSVFGR
eukprot:TRINITY_DN366758_c6_g1_i1.p1 TRINITY_DN366758_c6_g1~~TRINITY_DN366758_c6_g1_i1.p1  ORF type:complete len:536 (-),score=184.93 TRINITY_DN366758_c6_g1_i1:220-1827(-)